MSGIMEQDGKDAHQQVWELGTPSSQGQTSSADDGFGSNEKDVMHMHRMGKQQEMQRVFKQFSLVSFTAILMGSWQWQLLANSQGLIAGGRGGLFWSYVSP